MSKKEKESFYQVYFALLEFTNNKYNVNPRMKKIYKQTGINSNELIGIIEKFWSMNDSIIDEFLKSNPYRFGNYDKSLVEGFKRGFRGQFIMARYERDYTCLIGDDKCYMIKGINDNLDNIISYKNLPCFVETSILPFNGKIIYDGLFQSIPGLSMGLNFESVVNEELEKMDKVYKL